MKTFRFIRSHPSSAVHNMALDEKIFCRYLEDGVPTFRIYGWESPSFTYGLSGKPQRQIDIARCISDGLGVAKRMTGGGALFHHDEITYSLVCDKEDIGEQDGIFVSYRKICAFLISFYASLGLKASFAVESDDFQNRCAPNELCSASREKYDIVINGKKIGGNAQKRKRRAVFQHGSIPISVDWKFVRRYAPALPEDISSRVTTLAEELGTIPDKKVLERKLIDAAGHAFGARFIEEKVSL
jgi:lipoate-protein ligase A